LWTCGTTLSGDYSGCTNISNNTIAFNGINQLQDGTFIGIEYYTNQIWICKTQELDGRYTAWKNISPASAPFPLTSLVHLKDGTFIAIEYYSKQLWTCGTSLSGDKNEWKNIATNDVPSLNQIIQLNGIIQLKDGTFAGIERSTNQIRTCGKTLSGDISDWMTIAFSSSPFPLKSIIQLKDGTFAAIEYYSNQLWTCGTKLSGDYSGWTNISNNTIAFKGINQLQDGTFIGIEYGSNQMWKCATTTLSGKVGDWKNISPATSPFPLKGLVELHA